MTKPPTILLKVVYAFKVSFGLPFDTVVASFTNGPLPTNEPYKYVISVSKYRCFHQCLLHSHESQASKASQRKSNYLLKSAKQRAENAFLILVLALFTNDRGYQLAFVRRQTNIFDFIS